MRSQPDSTAVPSEHSTRRWGTAVAVAGLLFIAALTLVPRPEDTVRNAMIPPWCLVCGSLGGVDVLLNVLLFVPYGLGLRLAGWPWRRIVVAVVATTVAVEFLQLSIIAGRDASLSDVLTNSTGGLLGAWLGARWQALVFPRERTAGWLAALGGAIWLGILLITAWLVQPSIPASRYYGQWAADLPGFEQFEGRLLQVSLDGMPMPGTLIRRTPELRRRLQDSLRLEVKAVMAGPTAGLAPVFSIFDHRQRNIVMLGQDGRGFEFNTRMGTAPARLRPPTLRLEPDFPLQPGDTVELTARLAGGELGLAVRRDGQMSSRQFALGPQLGWAMLLPYDYAYGPAVHWLSALWIGGLLIPIGYWARRSGRRWPVTLAGAGVVVLVGLGVVPGLFGLPAVAWGAWAAAFLGMMIGSVAGAASVAPAGGPVE